MKGIDYKDYIPVVLPHLSLEEEHVIFLGRKMEMSKSAIDFLKLCDSKTSLQSVYETIGDPEEAQRIMKYLTRKHIIYLKPITNPRKGERNIIIAAHSDDFFYCLGGHLLKDRSFRIKILNVFSQDPNINIPDTSLSKQDVVEMRKKEDMFAASLVDADIEFWDYPAEFERGYQEWSDPLNWDIDKELYDEISSRLRHLVKSERETRFYFPLSIGNHVDHFFLRQVFLDLYSDGAFQQNVTFYEDLPYSYRLSSWSNLNVFFEENDIIIDPELIDITDVANAKFEGLYIYRCQVTLNDIKKIRSYSKYRMFDPRISFLRKWSFERNLNSMYERIWHIRQP